MKQTIKLLKQAKTIALFSHTSPDPDTVGSTLALMKILEKMGKKVDVFCAETNDKFAYLECYDRYSTDENAVLNSYDLLVAVDVPDQTMLCGFEQAFLSHKNTLRIDHHTKGNNYALHNICENQSACAVVIFEIAKKLKVKFDSEIATLLYFAICGDTGIFKNNNTDSVTFRICADLLDLGADFKKVYSEFFLKSTLEYIRLSSHILLNANVNDELGYVVMNVSKADYDKYNPEQNENISNLPNTYLNCGYKIAVVAKEKEDGIHCSFRSKFEYDCSAVAAVFGGGGHKNASGCLIDAPLEDAISQISKAVENYLKSI